MSIPKEHVHITFLTPWIVFVGILGFQSITLRCKTPCTSGHKVNHFEKANFLISVEKVPFLLHLHLFCCHILRNAHQSAAYCWVFLDQICSKDISKQKVRETETAKVSALLLTFQKIPSPGKLGPGAQLSWAQLSGVQFAQNRLWSVGIRTDRWYIPWHCLPLLISKSYVSPSLPVWLENLRNVITPQCCAFIQLLESPCPFVGSFVTKFAAS